MTAVVGALGGMGRTRGGRSVRYAPALHAVEMLRPDQAEGDSVHGLPATAGGKELDAAMVMLGGDKKTGRAPAGAMEDQLEAWLDAVMKVKAA